MLIHSSQRPVPLSAAARGVTLALLLIAQHTKAQERPSESDMFGAPAAPPAPAAMPAAPAVPAALSPTDAAQTAPPPPAASPVTPITSAPGPAPDTRDESILGNSESQMFTEQAAPNDPLTIGGQLYLRAQSTALQGGALKDAHTNLPTLLDVFMDARPNDRVRGFVLGRMSYDPLLPASGSGIANIGADAASGGTAGSASLSSLFSPQTNAPHLLLDQLWLRFDIAHTLFITAGRQHVRWGTGRFWSPTDFLHLRKRNPLDVFDARTGTTMLKVHLPIESKAWNFYAYGITEGQNGTPSLTTLGGAARAEFVLDSTELGLGVFGRPHERAKFAADLSSGIGDIDFYGEVAAVDAREADRVRFQPDATFPTPAAPPSWQAPQDTQRAALEQAIDALYPVYQDHGYRPQVVGGLNYSHKYNDNDVWTIGAEYFYNGFGYNDDKAYPGLVAPHTNTLNNPATFFYLGKHYAALFLSVPAPYKLDLHTFTLSTLGNLSDQSFITRLDYSYVLLTHLRFEAFGAVHYGRATGEFRFKLPTAAGHQAARIYTAYPPPRGIRQHAFIRPIPSTNTRKCSV